MIRIEGEGGTDGEITIPVGATAANRMYRNSCRIARDSRLRSRRARPLRPLPHHLESIYYIRVLIVARRLVARNRSRRRGERRKRVVNSIVLPTKWFHLTQREEVLFFKSLLNDNSTIIPIFQWVEFRFPGGRERVELGSTMHRSIRMLSREIKDKDWPTFFQFVANR